MRHRGARWPIAWETESRGSEDVRNVRNATGPRLTLGRYTILVETWEPWGSTRGMIKGGGRWREGSGNRLSEEPPASRVLHYGRSVYNSVLWR